MQIMKKISILLVFVMLVSMLGGCISKKTTAGDGSDSGNTDSVVTTDDNGNTDGNTPGESVEAGQELSGFIQTYMDAKTPLYDKLTDATETDFMMMSAWLGIMMSDITIAFVPFFDMVDANGGIFFLTEIDNAFKKISGNTIDFGYDYTYKADNSSGFPSGSHSTFVGKLNMDKGTLRFEMIDDKLTDGFTRSVVEINRNSANSYTTQFVTNNGSETTAYFTTFKGENFISYTCSKDEGQNYTYNSIYEKSNPSLDDMMAGFKIVSNIKYANGEATYSTEAP